MTAHLVTWMEGVLWASGEDFVDDPVGIIPFVLFDDGRRKLGTNAAGNALMFQE